LAANQQTTIYWGDSTPMSPYFNHYNIYRRTNGGPFTLLDSIFDKRTRFYTDVNTPNYSVVNYEYMIRSVNHCGNLGPPSDTLGTFEQLKFIPDQQQIVSVSVAKNKYVDITWPQTWENDFAQYFLYKKKASDNTFQLIYQTSQIEDTVYHDKDVDVSSNSYCYHVIMKDTCDNYGPIGYNACSILLKGEPGSFENNIWWTPYNWWYNGVSHYEVISQGDRSPQANHVSTPPLDSSFNDYLLDPNSGQFRYHVIAHQNDALLTGYGMGNASTPFYNAMSLSNEIDFVQKPFLYVPNAFTPNNDQLNDTWNIRDVFVKDYQLAIYNKWGQQIFSTTDKRNKWDGKLSSGKEAPSDVYIYLILYSGYDQTNGSVKGNVTLLR
jgi:gliding motility-associated-like protein